MFLFSASFSSSAPAFLLLPTEPKPFTPVLATMAASNGGGEGDRGQGQRRKKNG